MDHVIRVEALALNPLLFPGSTISFRVRSDSGSLSVGSAQVYYDPLDSLEHIIVSASFPLATATATSGAGSWHSLTFTYSDATGAVTVADALTGASVTAPGVASDGQIENLEVTASLVALRNFSHLMGETVIDDEPLTSGAIPASWRAGILMALQNSRLEFGDVASGAVGAGIRDAGIPKSLVLVRNDFGRLFAGFVYHPTSPSVLYHAVNLDDLGADQGSTTWSDSLYAPKWAIIGVVDPSGNTSLRTRPGNARVALPN